jgi:hypothetical protein
MAMPPRAAMQQSIIGGRNRAPSVTSSIQGLLRAFAEGRISVYADVIAMSR